MSVSRKRRGPRVPTKTRTVVTSRPRARRSAPARPSLTLQLESEHGVWLAVAGVVLTLFAMSLDVWQHRADTHLASHETPLTLANLSHAALMLGFAAVTAGVSAALVLAGRALQSKTRVALGGGVVLAALVLGLPAVYMDNVRPPQEDQHESTPPGTMPGMVH